MSELHKDHRKRIRARYLGEGLDHFAPHETLELLLTYAIPRRDVNHIAHRLLAHFGSISAVLEAPAEELMKVEGIGDTAAVLLKIIPDVCRVYQMEKADVADLFSSPQQIGEYMAAHFIGRTNEVVYLLCLDNKGKMLYCDMLSEGTIDMVPVKMRTVVEIALRVGAASVVLAHNHPQGFAIPSQGDIEVTRKAAQALKMVSVQLLDHIIVAGNDYVSLADSGLIRPLEPGD